MSYIIGLTGAHGTGKTTVRNYLENDLDMRRLCTVPAQVSLSRKVQAARGMSLPNIHTESLETIMDFQEAVLDEMVLRDQDLRHKTKTLLPIIVDRTPIDLVIYTLIWTTRFELMRNREGRERLHAYIEKCFNHTADTYAAIALFPVMSEIPFVAEDGRAGLDTRDEYDRTLAAYAPLICSCARVVFVDKVSVRDRASQVLDA